MGSRIGLFGGSFDPPHRGHLALAVQARDELALDALCWVPAGQPWQKAQRTLAPAEDRLAMVRLMIEGQAGMRVDDIELRREGPSYTIDTVEAMHVRDPGALLYLVIGQDQYAGLPTWHRWGDLVAAVTLAVAGRGDVVPTPPAELAGIAHRVVALHLPPVPVSSTDVRMRAQRGEDLRALVGDAVAGYIDRRALYRAPSPHTRS